MKNLWIVVLGLVLVGGVIYFSGGNKNEMMRSTGTPEVKPTVVPQPESSVDDNVVVVNMEAGSFYFNPNNIQVKKGQTVKIVLRAVSMMHDFYIDELGVKGPIVKNGDTGTVEFKADKVGKFEYYCSVGQHRKMGQVGTLTVTE